MYFSYRSEPDVFIPLSVTLVKEVLLANENGELPDDFKLSFKETNKIKVVEHSFENVVGQDSLTRFDRTKSNKPNFKNNPNKKSQHKKSVTLSGETNPERIQKKPQGQINPNPNQVKNTKPNPNQNKPQHRKPHHNNNKNNTTPNNDANKTNNPPQ